MAKHSNPHPTQHKHPPPPVHSRKKKKKKNLNPQSIPNKITNRRQTQHKSETNPCVDATHVVNILADALVFDYATSLFRLRSHCSTRGSKADGNVGLRLIDGLGWVMGCYRRASVAATLRMSQAGNGESET